MKKFCGQKDGKTYGPKTVKAPIYRCGGCKAKMLVTNIYLFSHDDVHAFLFKILIFGTCISLR